MISEIKNRWPLLLLLLFLGLVFYGLSWSFNSVSVEHEISKDTVDKSLDSTRISLYYKELWAKHDKNPLAEKSEHRGLGSELDTTVHYGLIQEALLENTKICKPNTKCKIMDAGCGMGSAMLYFHKLGLDVQGFTLAENQYSFIKSNFPELSVRLASYNELPDGIKYTGIYAIESLFHSDWRQTIEVWGKHLEQGSRIAVIDDFAVNQSSAMTDPDIQGYVKGWLLKAITTVDNLCAFATKIAGLRCISVRNLTLEFDINKNNYGNKVPELKIKYAHPALKGSYFRGKSSINGLLIYALVCLEKV